jgi:hypothetical protein
MAKRDTGMAGSSGYDSEFYTTDKSGKAQRNERTMKLQGMDPKKRMADSVKQEKRMDALDYNEMPKSDRDMARAKAVGMLRNNGNYDEGKLQNSIIEDDANKRYNAVDRGYSASVDIAKQKRQGEVKKQFGDNSFKPFTQNVPTLSKQIMTENAKKKR